MKIKLNNVDVKYYKNNPLSFLAFRVKKKKNVNALKSEYCPIRNDRRQITVTRTTSPVVII